MAEDSSGSFWLRGALDRQSLADLDGIATAAGRPGGRVDWTDPVIASALLSVTNAVDPYLAGARLTRVVWFTKDANSNWGVPWHQDRVIAVADRHDVAGFNNWSKKGPHWHCEPPLELFAAMRFVRVHLDDCDASNGAMEIARGSEAEGLVRDADAAEVARRYPVELCSASRGDIQIVPMLVLHRSRPATSDAPRRALRIDFALADLPAPLSWCAE